ncbi:MAG: GNAT family N-acetyltransferase [Lachnospiraceae bacterium]|nr:GNAT family N-acetyltransferase [Lachnospiraceae bacterium]
MIRLTNLTDEELKAIGRRIGEAFCDEGEGLFTRLDRGDAIMALEIMTECYYRLGVLYATSERQEGHLAYWRKGEAKGWGMKMVRVSLHMAWRFLREIPFGSLKKLLPLMNNPYEKIYQKEPDYVVISMVAVRREFQGQGYLRVLLEEPFRIAQERNIPCVLDTDTDLKVKKYISCGMKKAAETPIKGGGTMYTMEGEFRSK